MEAEVCFVVATDAYPRVAVYRTCYQFTDRAYLWLEPVLEGVRVLAAAKAGAAPLDDAFIGEFRNSLIDHAVRHTVAERTRSIREQLIAAALIGATTEPSS